MAKTLSLKLEEAVAFAEKVLNAKPGEIVGVSHQYNYFNRIVKKARQKQQEAAQRIIYTGPGKARSVELKLSLDDPRKGKFPQHNSPGIFRLPLESFPSLSMDLYGDMHTQDCLEKAGYQHRTVSVTKKSLGKLSLQFANLSPRCFKDMMCLYDSSRRDYDVMVKEVENGFINIAYVNPVLELIQFIQTIKYNEHGQVIDLRHVVFEAGTPLVINQTTFDCYGNLRNIAHVGITGSTKNGLLNSLERFDDGTVAWTSTSMGRFGTAVLKDDGEVILLTNPGDLEMAAISGRNLGAEGINSTTLAWSGKFALDACLKEIDDKYIVRREYKTAVRKQVYQIIDGACIPGLEPIFRVSR